MNTSQFLWLETENFNECVQSSSENGFSNNQLSVDFVLEVLVGDVAVVKA